MIFKSKRNSGAFSYLVVGLGNPGIEYEKTRHNAGFAVIDRFAEKLSIDNFRMKFNSSIADGKLEEHRILIAKPTTYMNNSGRAVREICGFYKISPENIIVVYDDISLEPGKLRIRLKGSAGGHNGIKDIIEELGTDQFPRIKVGVGKKPHPEYDLKDWVLGKFAGDDLAAFSSAADKAVLALEEMIRSGNAVGAMNRYNG